MDLLCVESVLNKISSPDQLIHALNEIKDAKISKLSNNLLKLFRNILWINAKDLEQYNGILIVYTILHGGFKNEHTDADWLILHEEFSKLVISFYECVLNYERSNLIKDLEFCKLIIKASKLILPLVYKKDAVRALVIREGFNVLAALICLNELDCKFRRDLFILLKPIMIKTDSRQRKLIMANSDPLLSSMAKLTITCGDYETQEGLIEMLMRFSYISRQKLMKIELWFKAHINDPSVVKILDYNNFDVSCREFLNTINSAALTSEKVITLPCLEALANDIQLRKPNVEQYREFWIDFSISTGVVHVVCDIDKNSWLKLAVEQNMVKKITSSKRLACGSLSAVQFLIELSTPLRVILNSSEKYIATVTLIFLSTPKIAELKKLFFRSCFKEVYKEEIPLLNSSFRQIGNSTDNFWDNVSSISSIHTSSSCRQKREQKETPVAVQEKSFEKPPVPEQLHASKRYSIVTSTPLVLLEKNRLMNTSKENIEISGTSQLKLIDKSDYTKNEFVLNKVCNINKRQKSSLVKYQKTPSLPEEDCKFKEMCEKRLAQMIPESPVSSHSEPLSEAGLPENNDGLGMKKPYNQVGGHANFRVCDRKDKSMLKLDKVKSDLKQQNTSRNSVNEESEEESPFVLSSCKFAKPNTIVNIGTKKQGDMLKNVEPSKINHLSNISKGEELKTDFTSTKFNSGNFSVKPSNNMFSNLYSKISLSNKVNKVNQYLRAPKLNIIKSSKVADTFEEKPRLTCLDERCDVSVSLRERAQTPNSMVSSGQSHVGITNPPDKPKFKEINIPKQSTGGPKPKQCKPSESLGSPILLSGDWNQNKCSSNLSSNTMQFVNNKLPSDSGIKNQQIDPEKRGQLANSYKLDLLGRPVSRTSTTAELKVNGANEMHKETYPFTGKPKLSSQSSSKEKKLPSENGIIDLYHWDSSKSNADEEESLFSNLSLKKTAGMPFLKKYTNTKMNKALTEVSNQGSPSLTSADKTRSSNLSQREDLSITEKSSSNHSIHCRIPAKTYGNKGTCQALLQSSSDQIFDKVKKNQLDIHSSVNGSKISRKRKLYNPNDYLDVDTTDKRQEENESSPENVYLISGVKNRFECEKICSTKNIKVQNIFTSTAKEQETLESRLALKDKSSTPKRRKSLRLMAKVKYTEKSSGDEAIEPDQYSLGTKNVKGEKRVENGPQSLPTSSKETHTSDVTGNESPFEKLLHLERTVGTAKKQSTDLNIITSNVSSDYQSRTGISIAEHHVKGDDVLREQFHSDLSLEGVPAEEEKREERLLELVEPPLRLSTDSSSNSGTPPFPDTDEPCKADSQPHTSGTQTELWTELCFLDTVLSHLKKITTEEDRRKILTEVTSLERAVKSMDLFMKSTNKDLKRKCVEAKKNLVHMMSHMEKMVLTCDDIINSFQTKIADVQSTTSRVSRDVRNNTDLKLKLLEELEKLCEDRRNTIREEKFLI